MKKVVFSVLLMSSTLPVIAENNLSAELLLGIADQELSASGYSTASYDTSFGIRGSHSLSENFSVEGIYHSYCEANYTYTDKFGDTITDKLNPAALSLGIKGILPLNNGVSVNARIGVSFWGAEIKHTDSAYPGEIFKSEDSGTDLYYGIGAQYQVNSQLFIGVEYTKTKMSISTEVLSDDLDIKNISFSLGYYL